MSWGSSPAGPPPPDDDRHWVLNTVGWVGTGIATIVVCARLFTRYHLLRTADYSDVVLAISAIFGIIATSLQTVAGEYGAGRHVIYLTKDQIEHASLFGTVAVPFGQMAMALPKIATAAVLMRIAGPMAGIRTKVYFYSITVGLCVISVLYCIFIFVQCSPVFTLWTDTVDASKNCWPPHIIGFIGLAVSIVSTLVDLNLAIYPILIIRRLQMKLRRKISICVMMGLGLLATICAAFKIPHLQDQASPDITYNIIDLTCWTLAEMNLILITASIPLLRPFWLWCIGKPLVTGTNASSLVEGPQHVAKRLHERRGFKSFGSKHDTDVEMTIDVAYDETVTPRSGGRALLTPPSTHDIKVERSVVITHEDA